MKICLVLVAHACTPSYSGGRYQEDHNSKPAWANSLQDSISNIPPTKKGLVEWLKVKALSSSHSTAKTTRATKKTKLEEDCQRIPRWRLEGGSRKHAP
jgi:hypothetical protein